MGRAFGGRRGEASAREPGASEPDESVRWVVSADFEPRGDAGTVEGRGDARGDGGRGDARGDTPPLPDEDVRCIEPPPPPPRGDGGMARARGGGRSPRGEAGRAFAPPARDVAGFAPRGEEGTFASGFFRVGAAVGFLGERGVEAPEDARGVEVVDVATSSPVTTMAIHLARRLRRPRRRAPGAGLCSSLKASGEVPLGCVWRPRFRLYWYRGTWHTRVGVWTCRGGEGGERRHSPPRSRRSQPAHPEAVAWLLRATSVVLSHARPSQTANKHRAFAEI